MSLAVTLQKRPDLMEKSDFKTDEISELKQMATELLKSLTELDLPAQEVTTKILQVKEFCERRECRILKTELRNSESLHKREPGIRGEKMEDESGI